MIKICGDVRRFYLTRLLLMEKFQVKMFSIHAIKFKGLFRNLLIEMQSSFKDIVLITEMLTSSPQSLLIN